MPYLITVHDDGSVSMEFEKNKPIQRNSKGRSEVLFPKSYVVVDLETTGFSAQYDNIIEIAALKVIEGVVSDRFHTLINPECEIDEYITSLTGITNDMVASAPIISSVLSEFISFIGNYVVVGHKVSFDINFIYDVNLKLFDNYFKNNYVDTMRIARKLYPEMPHHRLKDIVKLFDIEQSQFHRAMSDCDMTYKCFEALRNAVLLKYPSEEAFLSSFVRYSKLKFGANSLSTSVTEFDKSHPLFEKHCVFTGVLEKMERKEAMQIVIDFGGLCDDRVTKKTNYLILGNNDYCSTIKDGKSSKQKKAEEYKLNGCDIEIIPEDIFYDIVEQSISLKGNRVECLERFDDSVVDLKNSKGYYGNDLSLTDFEKNALVILSDIFSKSGLNFSDVHLARRSESYLSVITDTDKDFLRIKVGTHSKWISLDLWICGEEIRNDSRLSCVKSRNVRHWKIPLASIDDLKSYSDIICASYIKAL